VNAVNFLIPVVVLVGLIAYWASRRLTNRTIGDPGVEANARLTAYAAVVLLLPLAAEVVTGARPGLEAHALIGFLLVPPVLVKLGSVGYRFARYYTGDPRYRAGGPPEVLMRLLGPALVLLTVVLFVTGIELWLFGFEFGNQWLTWHKASFVLWFLAMTVHVAAYTVRASALALADSRDRLPGVFARRSLVVGSLLFGLALAIAMFPFASPFTLLPGAG
jgi:hypothetical protein